MLAIGVIVIIQRTRKAPESGLVYAYLVGIWLIHWPAAFLYTLPWYWNWDVNIVAAGFSQSTYGILGFAFGIFCLRVFLSGSRFASVSTAANPPQQRIDRGLDMRLPLFYITLGLFSTLVLAQTIGRIATINALVAATSQLIVVGLSLACWQAWQKQRYAAFIRWLVVALTLPFFTITIQGFLGFGVFAMVSVLAFVAHFVRLRPLVILLGLLFVYLSVSFYVSYMRDRSTIRMIVWNNNSLANRMAQVYDTTTNIEWFDPRNIEHLRRIDERLNQNVLVGSSVAYISSGYQQFAQGRTFRGALLAVVPRILWPDKPNFAGGTAIVTAYTGMVFASGTSVGLGQVLEFYINFGTISVVIGFMILGMLIAGFDLLAARYLYRGDLAGFTFWFLPGLGLLVAGNSLGVMVPNVVAGFAVAILLNRGLKFARCQHMVVASRYAPRVPGRQGHVS